MATARKWFGFMSPPEGVTMPTPRALGGEALAKKPAVSSKTPATKKAPATAEVPPAAVAGNKHAVAVKQAASHLTLDLGRTAMPRNKHALRHP